MTVILRYFLLQWKNYSNNLTLRLKIEIVILFIIFFAFFTEKLTLFFYEILIPNGLSPIGLSGFIAHILLLSFLLGIPFIYVQLMPKQNGLQIMRTLPLQSPAGMTLLSVYHLKYQILEILLAFPVTLALFISAGILAGFYQLSILLFFPPLFFLFYHILSVRIIPHNVVLLFYYASLLIFLGSLTFFYVFSPAFPFGDLAFLGGILIYIWRQPENIWTNWDDYIFSTSAKVNLAPRPALTYLKIPKLLPRKIRALFNKEFLSYWRNPAYCRLKWFSGIATIAFFGILSIFSQSNREELATVFGIVMIWHHFSGQFNEKYAQPDTAYFIKTFPLKFFSFAAARFLNEMFAVTFFLILFLLTGLFFRFSFISLLQSCIIILIFSVVILLIMTFVKILFYDNPRLAGFAFHFMVIFTLIMSLNFYIVGSLVTLFLLVYICYLSYKEFAR